MPRERRQQPGAQHIGFARRVRTAGNRRIEEVLLDQAWGMGIGGSMTLEYRPVTLYSDGTYTRDVNAALTGSGASQRWRKEGTNYLLSEPKGKIDKIPAKMMARPAKPKQMLTGRYTSFSGLGGGGTGTTMVAAYKNFNFAADGTVRLDRGAGASAMDYRMGSAKAGDYGYEPLGVYHEHTNFTEDSELIFTNYGPICFVNEDMSPKFILDWKFFADQQDGNQVGERKAA
jgi:hypothetical protein